jgi:tRNA/tmRNA/rRNA uracil-C5-methylase (TrmA/RlmC/RlmD family)
MHIDALRENWDAFGKLDPLWAIVTDPTKKGGKWDLDEFFQSGEERIGNVMRPLEANGIPEQRARALDFGCGVGRFTRALAKRFERSTAWTSRRR